jgi:hypothetical protein
LALHRISLIHLLPKHVGDDQAQAEICAVSQLLKQRAPDDLRTGLSAPVNQLLLFEAASGCGYSPAFGCLDRDKHIVFCWVFCWNHSTRSFAIGLVVDSLLYLFFLKIQPIIVFRVQFSLD